MLEQSELVTTAEAAARLGVTPNQIGAWHNRVKGFPKPAGQQPARSGQGRKTYLWDWDQLEAWRAARLPLKRRALHPETVEWARRMGYDRVTGLDLDAIKENAISMKAAGYPNIRIPADVLVE